MSVARYFLLVCLLAVAQSGISQYTGRPSEGSDVSYHYDYPGDNLYLYGVKNNEWYTMNIKTGKTYNISRDAKYISTIKKLDALYPGVRRKPQSVVAAGNDVRYIYIYPGDKVYIYGIKNGEWYAKNTKNNKTFNINRDPKYRSTVMKLDQLYPDARW